MRLLLCALSATLAGLIIVAPVPAQRVAQPAVRGRAPAGYDGIGTLVRNTDPTGSHAPFALVDESGIVKSYVYPPRGVALDEFVDRRVGVRGRVRQNAGDGAPHVWADSAAVLLGRSATAHPAAFAQVENAAPVEELPAPGGAAPRMHRAMDSSAPSIMQGEPYVDESIHRGTLPGGALPEGAYLTEPGSEGEVYYDAGMSNQGAEWVDGAQAMGDGQYDPYTSGEGPMLYPPQGSGGGIGPGSGGRGGLLGYGWVTGAWVRAEYLYWRTDGMDVPALVTASPAGTPRTSAGVLGETGTRVLFGNNTINDDWRSGGRIRFGAWLDPRYTWGVEGEYLMLNDETTGFAATSDGLQILARPFFDILQAQESAELVAFPGILSGRVGVDATTAFQSAGVRGLYRVCGHDACQGGPCGAGGCCQPQSPGWAYRVDFLAGYRYLRLDDDIAITENLTSLDPINPGSFVIRDSFATENRFHGGEVGFQWATQRGRWTLDLLTKVALGNNRQSVRIAGNTAITEDGETTNDVGGLLAQRTNIGSYGRDVFSVVPELGATLGYQITPRLRAVVGYSLIYFSNVVRAGDQIDLDVNTNLLPPEADPFSGPLRPRFAFRDSDFWAHGVSAGLDFRF